MSEDRAPIEQLLDVVLYAPLGVALEVHRRLPDYVREGRQQAEQRVVLARFIGQMAVKVGRQELTRRLAQLHQQDAATSPAEPELAQGAQVAALVDTTATEAESPVPGDRDAEVDEPAGIHGYASLSASQLVGRLDALTDEELAAVEAYESTHRRRRTVLAKVAQLRATRGT